MNIVCSVASLLPQSGGPSRSTGALCQTLASLGVGVDLLSLDFGNQGGIPIIPRDPVRTKLVPCRFSRQFRVCWAPKFSKALLNRIKASAPRLIHDNGLWLTTNHAAAKVARQCGLPLVLSTRGMLAPWALRHKSWKKWLAWRLYQAVDVRSAKLIHATCLEEARAIRAVGLTQPVAIVPNGVDLPRQRESLGPKAVKTVLFLGRIHPVKGLMNLVAAWEQLRPVGWRMLLAGPDEEGHRAELAQAISRAKLNDVFSFTGAVTDEEKAELYRLADLFVLPSFSENFGLAIAEALANGVPVITTKGTPWREIESRGCGWWTDVGIAPLSRCLSKATAISDGERCAMGLRGRQFVEECFSWRKIGADMIAVYEWVLGYGSKPDCVVDE